MLDSFFEQNHTAQIVFDVRRREEHFAIFSAIFGSVVNAERFEFFVDISARFIRRENPFRFFHHFLRHGAHFFEIIWLITQNLDAVFFRISTQNLLSENRFNYTVKIGFLRNRERNLKIFFDVVATKILRNISRAENLTLIKRIQGEIGACRYDFFATADDNFVSANQNGTSHAKLRQRIDHRFNRRIINQIAQSGIFEVNKHQTRSREKFARQIALKIIQ